VRVNRSNNAVMLEGGAKRRLRVLDAGCGRQFHLSYPGLNLRDAHVVGIDVSQTALAKNEMVAEKILGDLQTYPLAPASFDVIICQDVLEHLPHPKQALENMSRALRPGGEIVIAVSNPCSLKGLITKFTPHAFHVFVYRRGYFGYRFVDDPAYPPFKTYLRWSIRPAALGRFLRERDFAEIHVALREPERLSAWWSHHRWLARALKLWPNARLSECQIRARRQD
jgi:2-polyprenyl-3-methyl-5-hydroxy-6-metoxy-1,4-benzoquinol methylase